jgi:hypothetical protein
MPLQSKARRANAAAQRIHCGREGERSRALARGQSRVAAMNPSRDDSVTFAPQANFIDLAFQATPPGKYLAPRIGGSPDWSETPQYFSIPAVENDEGRPVFTVALAIAAGIVGGAKVRLSSRDGFIATSLDWPHAKVRALSPSGPHWMRWAAALAILIVIAASALAIVRPSLDLWGRKPARAPAASAGVDSQQAELDGAIQAGTIAAFDAFVGKYPAGPLANIAQREREKLRQAAAPPPAPAPQPSQQQVTPGGTQTANLAPPEVAKPAPPQNNP